MGDQPVAPASETFNRLAAHAQRCLKTLSLFEGPFTHAAVEGVVGQRSKDTLLTLRSLVEQSLIRATKTSGMTEYYLLDEVRSYARERLFENADDAALTIVAYVAYYLGLIEELTAEGARDRMVPGLGKEWHNIHAALAHVFERKIDVRRACTLLPRVTPFWSSTGRAVEGVGWLTRALESSSLSQHERVELLDAAARVAANALMYVELEPLARALVAERERNNSDKLLADALFMLANAVDGLGRYDEAKGLYHRALRQYDTYGSASGRARVLGTQGVVLGRRAASREELMEALGLLEQALAIFRVKEPSSLPCAEAFINLAEVCIPLGYYDKALTYADEALGLYSQFGNVVRIAALHVTIAEIRVGQGEPLEAIAVLQSGRRMIEGEYRPLLNACTAEVAFKAAVDLGAFAIASQLYGFARFYRTKIGVPPPVREQQEIDARLALVERSLGDSFLAQGMTQGETLDPAGLDTLLEQLRSSCAAPAARVQASLFAAPQPDTSDGASSRGAETVHLERGRLSLRIGEAARFPAAFVIANRRWGKSIAVDDYLARSKSSVIRLTVAPAVTSLSEFLSAFRGAVAVPLPHTVATASEQSEPDEQILAWLSSFRGTVLLDQVHHINRDPGIALMLYKVIRATAGRVQWVFLSCEVGQAPFGQCDAHGLTGAPVDERDLAFTVDEVLEYAQILQLGVSHHEAVSIVEFTGGWPYAVAVALRAYAKVFAKDELVRRDEVELQTVSVVSAYLRETVYQLLSPAETRMILAMAAMPGDSRIDALRAVDPTAENTLTQLRLKVPIVTAGGGLFRLTHLIREFVRGELERSPDRMDVSQAVADALEVVGDTASAIKVLLNIGSYERAMKLLVHSSQHWTDANWPNVLEAAVSRLPAQMLENNPAVLLARAAGIDQRGRWIQAFDLLERARKHCDRVLLSRIACMQAAIALNNHAPANVQALEDALSDATESVLQRRIQALLCCAYVSENRTDDAASLLNSIAEAVDGLAADDDARDVLYWAALAHYGLCDYERSGHLATRIIRESYVNEPCLVLAQAHALLASIEMQRGRPAESILKHLDDALDIAKGLQTARYRLAFLERQASILLGHADLLRIEHAMNQPGTGTGKLWSTYSTIFRLQRALASAASAESLEEASSAYLSAAPIAKTLVTDPVLRQQGSIARSVSLMVSCLANEPSARTVVAETLTDPPEPPENPMSLGEVGLWRRHATIQKHIAVLCQAFLGEHQSVGDLSALLEVRTDDLIESAVATIVRTILYAVRSKRPLAMGQRHANDEFPSLADHFALLSTAGYDTITILLTEFARKSTTLVATGVTLSKTEMGILSMLADGRSAAEIAKERVVSVNTVNSQIKSLYRKLEAKNAAAAIQRGRSLGLL